MNTLKYIFGIDIGGTNIKYGIFDSTGTLIKKSKSPTSHAGPKEVISQIANFVKNANLPILGIGIGVPGPVVDNTVYECVNLNWPQINIKQEFQSIFPNTPIIVHNDANLAALGEYRHNANLNNNRLLFVTLGTGVGAGVIDDGRIIIGHNGAAAEIGHLPLPYIAKYSTIVAAAGYNKLEHLASARGLVNCAKILLATPGATSKLNRLNSFAAPDIKSLAQAGDQISQEAITMTATYLAYGLASAADIINPSHIILGGGLSESSSSLLPQVNTIFKEKVFKPNRQITIKISKLGNDAGIYGAAALFLS